MRSWGDESVCLELPGTTVLLQGLSSGQCAEIAQGYGRFVRATGAGSDCPEHVVCTATRSGRDLGEPAEIFCRKGYYVAEKRRCRQGLELRGFKFEGYFDRHARPGSAELAVSHEPDLVDPVVLENFLRILVAHRVLENGGALLHSSGVVWEGLAYLFCGPSGAGKTTLARKGQAAGAAVLSDDINLVSRGEGGYRAHRVPFTGELGRGAENLAGAGWYPLGGIVLLGQGPGLRLELVTPAAAVGALLAGCPFVNDDPEELPVVFDVLTELVLANPVRKLEVGLEDSFGAVMARLAEVIR